MCINISKIREVLVRLKIRFVGDKIFLNEVKKELVDSEIFLFSEMFVNQF